MAEFRKYLPSKETRKAVAAGVVTLAAYLTGVIPAEGGLGDVSTVQWLGAIVFLGAAYGITYQIRNDPRPAGEVGQANIDLLLLVACLVGIVLLLFGVSFR
jgi:cation transport ATPase